MKEKKNQEKFLLRRSSRDSFHFFRAQVIFTKKARERLKQHLSKKQTKEEKKFFAPNLLKISSIKKNFITTRMLNSGIGPVITKKKLVTTLTNP